MRWIVFGALLASACGGDSLLGAGKVCVTSEECAAGLLCDTTKSPHVCSDSVAVKNDLSVPLNRDLAGLDLSASPSTD